nr:unnamed protein product [Spirometra erinaceieuropaei]
MEKSQIGKRWVEHFRTVLSRPSTVSEALKDQPPYIKTNDDMDLFPSSPEISRAVYQLPNGKAPGSDMTPAEIHKHRGLEFKPEQIQMQKHAAGFNLSDADAVNLVATIESVLKHSQEPSETKHLIRQQVISLVMTHKPRFVILRAQQDALRALKADKSIMILPADKG